MDGDAGGVTDSPAPLPGTLTVPSEPWVAAPVLPGTAVGGPVVSPWLAAGDVKAFELCVASCGANSSCESIAVVLMAVL